MNLALARVARSVGVLTAAGLMLLAPSVGAHAAGPSPVSISGIEVKNGTLFGLVTSGSSTAAIDPSLKVVVAGKSYPVDAIASGQAGSRVSRSAIILVDTSGSMGEQGMATVRSAVTAFLGSVPDDVSIGVISFAGGTKVDLAPTRGHGAVQSAVNKLTSKGETALYDGLALAVKTLGSSGDRSILLLSDGGDTASKTATKATVTASLKGKGIRTQSVAFKTSDGDSSVLKSFATASGGSVISASNSGAVANAFTSAARTLASQLTFSMPLPVGVSAVQNVAISGTAGGAAFSSTALVDFGAGVAAPAASTAAAGDKDPVLGPEDQTVKAAAAAADVPVLGVPLPIALAVGAIFLGVLVLGSVLVAPSKDGARKNRVQNIERYVSAAGEVAGRAKSASPSAISQNLVGFGDKVMQGRDSTSRTMSLMTRADLPLRAGEWWVLRIVAVLVGAAVSVVLFRGGLIVTGIAVVAGALIGLVLPSAVLRFLARRRAKKFDSQLPDVLTLVASSLSTGFSLPQALDAVAKDAPEPSAKEFSRALAETRIGTDVADALEHLSNRMDSGNMRWTAMAIRIQREVGGNLAETLRTTAKTLRSREELQRHVRALSAEGRLSAYILVALPVGIFFYTMKTNRSYVELLWTRTIGIGMLVAGLISLGLGILWMRKVVNVEV